MKRSGELKRTTPLRAKSSMSRSSALKVKQKASVVAVKNALHGAVRTTGKPRQKAMKHARPKMTPIRKSAKGEACTLRIPGVCCGDPATTVWAHANDYASGKGMGIKARDHEGCYACHTCHLWIDGGYAGSAPREVRDKYFDLARTESQAILKQKGLMPCS